MSWCQFVWVGIVPSNTTLCFQWFFLFWMCSTNTFSLLNNHIDLPHSHQRGNLWNLWRKLKQTLEVSEYPGVKNRNYTSQLSNMELWEWLWNLLSTCGKLFPSVCSLPSKTLYIPTYEHVTHAASLMAEHTCPISLARWLALANGIGHDGHFVYTEVSVRSSGSTQSFAFICYHKNGKCHIWAAP